MVENQQSLNQGGGKPKTVCIVVYINMATTTEQDHHQSVRALATELKISWESSISATSPFARTHVQ